jgi:exodeoxyribonuclease V alpha subunit
MANELAMLVPQLSAADRPVFEALVVASWVATNQGSSRTPLDPKRLGDLLATCAKTPEAFAGPAADLLEDPALESVVGKPGDYKPLIVSDGWLYHQRLLHYEDRLVAMLEHRLNQPFDSWPQADLEAALDDLRERPTRLPDGSAMSLSPEQHHALLTSLHAPLTIITGGPGTGKTSIVVSLLRLFARLGLSPARIALAAPTGKAAHRMGESIASQLASLQEPSAADQALAVELPTARTLHRLLEYSPSRGTFRRSAEFPIDAELVVVDEASMIDLVLMERLTSAVAPDARLVLLGDAEQLPSVETGTVLRDLIPDETSTDTPWASLTEDLPERNGTQPTARHAVRLTTSYRMSEEDSDGAAVLAVAERIRAGDVDGALAAMRDEGEGGVVFEAVDKPDATARRARLRAFVDDWFEREIETMPHRDRVLRGEPFELIDGLFSLDDVETIRAVVEHLQRSRLLCLTRVWATGSEALNDIFHQRIARELGYEGNAPDFLAGDLVLMQRNDYERGLFNGDQGLILRVRIGNEERRMAVFPQRDSFRAHHLPALRGQLDHAFAMTVHKSQGSEFDEVAVILPEEDIPLLTRELLYTGITRCRRRAFVVGDTAMFETAVQRPIARYTGIREKLA